MHSIRKQAGKINIQFQISDTELVELIDGNGIVLYSIKVNKNNSINWEINTPIPQDCALRITEEANTELKQV